MKKKRLFLIDGNSLLYRSYYAIRHLSNSQGLATNAIYGFVSMLKKLIDKEKPNYLGIVFDSKGPTIRHEIFKEYKANRKPMPEDLVPQVSVLKDLLSAFKIPLFQKTGYEGDDLLGSLANKARDKNIQTIIVSNDKDLFQLINKSTLVFDLAKGVFIDEQKVKDAFGVRPSQIVDMLALKGDPVDNIPGVAGIGGKTAVNLIRQFGSLEHLLLNLTQVQNPKVRLKLEQGREALELSRRLVTIVQTIDLDFELKDFLLSEPDYPKLIPLLQKLEFTSLLSEYLQKSDQTKKKYATILEEAQLEELIAQINKSSLLALDTETDSPQPTRARMVGMSFSLESGRAYYLPLRHDYLGAPSQLPQNKVFKKIQKILSNPKIKKAGQNLKYDYIVFKREGIELKGIEFDSMLLSYLCEPNWGKHNLNRLALTYLHVQPIPYSELVGKGKGEITMNKVDIAQAAPYACQDADLALQLSMNLWKKVQEKNLAAIYRNLELPLITVLADMEMWGIKINSQILSDISSELNENMDRLKRKIYEHSGEEFNLNSPQQLAHILFEKLKLPSSKKTQKTRSFSTRLSVLQDLSRNYPIAQFTLEYRQLTKLKSTYADALPLLINPETGRIHTSYNQTVAATGRLSSSDPNLQNIPIRGEWGPRFRRAFIPEPENLFLSADYSQIELRVLAHMAEDPGLIDTFLHDRDIHQETASRVFGNETSLFDDEPRRRAKIINFSIIYGTSAFSLARELGTSTAEAQTFINRYFEKYPEVFQFLEQSVHVAEEKGYSETLFGRQRQVPELRQKNKIAWQAGRRIALNTPIQGTAADLMKMAMINIWREIKKQKLKTKMILQVHDELVFEVPKREYELMEKLVQDKMENVFPLKVPLKVHIGWGVNWAEAK